ncbi:unnamed protein product [Closterium sp. NIES-65]|nr:unnamed protein product [Closterium sp. NIES-65]
MTTICRSPKLHLQFHTLADLHSFATTMRASGHSLTSLRLGPTPTDASHWEDPFSAAQSIHLVLDQHRVHLVRSLPASLNSLSVSAHSLDLHCHCEAPLSLDFLMLIGRKRLVVASLPLASAKDVYLNAPSMQEESVNPLTNPPHSLSNLSHSPQISPNQPSISRELHSPSISESSLIRVLQSVAPTVEALMVPHSLPIESVEGEWRELHCLAIGVRGSKAGRGRCKTAVEAAEARAGGISPLRSLLFATRRCNSDTLVSLQEDFPSLEIYCVVGRLLCWKPIGSERLSQPIVCVSVHRAASNAPRFETTEGSSGEIDVGDFMDGLQCL